MLDKGAFDTPFRGVATKNSLVRPREQQVNVQRGMCMCMYFIKTIIIIIVDIGHLNSGADAGYCEKFFVDHAHFCIDHAPFRSRLSLNCGAARKTTKEPVSFLIVAVVNKTKTPKIM